MNFSKELELAKLGFIKHLKYQKKKNYRTGVYELFLELQLQRITQ